MTYKSAFVCFLFFFAVSGSKALPDDIQTFEKIEQKLSSLKLLVNSSENKKIFSSFPYCENAFFDQSTNTLGTLDFMKDHSYQKQPYVANGYFGARIPNLGHGFAYDSYENASFRTEDVNNGWPLFNKRFAGAFVAGFFNSQKNTTGNNFPWLYQYGWDSVISAIPQWTFLSIASDAFILDPSKPTKSWGGITNYVQNLSLENGIVSTSFTWLDKLHLNYEVSANKNDINVGTVSLVVENPSVEAVSITVTDTIDFKTSQRCDFVSSRNFGERGIQMTISPKGVSDVFGTVYSKLYLEGPHSKALISTDNILDVSQEVTTVILPGESLKFTKLVGIFTTDLDPEFYKSPEDLLRAAELKTSKQNLDELHSSHNEAWLSALGRSSSIIFPDSPLLTMSSKASVYHINANMRAGATGLTSALSVSGLSSDSYGGQVFWDTDLWISMGILPFSPSVSKSLLNYRIQSHEQAIKNILSPSGPKKAMKGAIYPWTSGRFGNCTATGPCYDYEYHINAAIAHSAIQIYLSGAVDDDYLKDTIFPLVFDAALFFSSYLEYDTKLSQYVSKNLTDPDEFAEFVDNGAYTNAAISSTIRWATIIAKHLGKRIPESFTAILDHIHIPYSPDDDNLVLEYTGMNSSIGVKQADVIMITYPLENELISSESAIKNLKYYATRQVSTGPAMTFSIFSIVSSAMLDTGCSSESYLLKSIIPFVRGPFAQFSEQSHDDYHTNGGTHPAFPFLTAHGGFLQTVLMGLLGMRFSYELEGNRIQRVLAFNAKNLSLFPSGVHFDEVKYMNTSLSISLEDSFLTVTNNGPIAGTSSSDTHIKIVSNSVPGVKEKRILKNFETAIFKVPSRKKADINSLTECGAASFINLSAGAQGDVVDSLHDGDNSTFWQAESDGEAQVLIDLKSRKLLKGGFVNWGDSPALNIKIYAHKADDELKWGFQETGPQKGSNSESTPVQVILDEKSWNFQEVHASDVQINAPFDPNDYHKVKSIDRFNTTTFEFSSPVECSLVLVKFSGSHNSRNNGAKVFDMSFYEM